MAGNVQERRTALSTCYAVVYAVVLAPSDAPDIEAQAPARMAPFERDLEGPREYYAEPDQVQWMTKQCDVSPIDLEAIYAHWPLEDIAENAHARLDDRA